MADAPENEDPIVTGVLQPTRYDGISLVRGGCNTPLTKEIQPFALGWRSLFQQPRYPKIFLNFTSHI